VSLTIAAYPTGRCARRREIFAHRTDVPLAARHDGRWRIAHVHVSVPVDVAPKRTLGVGSQSLRSDEAPGAQGGPLALRSPHA
jgi:hypothetical protein